MVNLGRRDAILAGFGFLTTTSSLALSLNSDAKATQVPRDATQIVAKQTALARAATHQYPENITNREYLRRQLATLAYIANLADSPNLTRKQRAEHVARIRRIVEDGNLNALDPIMVRGVERIFDPRTPDQIAELEQVSSLLGGGVGVIGGFVSVVNPWLGAAIAAEGFLITTLPELATPEPLPHDVTLQRISALARERAFALHAESSNTRSLLDDDLIRNAFGINFGAPASENVEYVPAEIRASFREVIRRLDEGVRLSDNDIARISTEVQQGVSRQLDNWRSTFRDEMAAIISEDRERIERARIAQQRSRQEINGAIYLGGMLADALFGPETGRTLVKVTNAAIQSADLYAAFAAGALGPIGLAAGLVSIGQGLFGGPSPEAQIMEALRTIMKGLEDLRREMHIRFDEVVENQRIIVNSLDDMRRMILERLNFSQLEFRRLIDGLDIRVALLRNYVEAQDRTEIINRFKLAITNARTEIEDDRPNIDVIQRSLDTIWHHATEESRGGAFNSSHVDTWDSRLIATQIAGLARPDHGVALLSLITGRISGVRGEVIANPLEWSRAAAAFFQLLKAVPVASNDEMRRRSQELRKMRLALVETLAKSTDRRMVSAFVNSQKADLIKILDHFGRIYQQFLREYGMEFRGRGQIQAGKFSWDLDTSLSARVNSIVRIQDIPPRSYLIAESPSLTVYGDFANIVGKHDPISVARAFGLIQFGPSGEGVREIRAADRGYEEYRTSSITFTRGPLRGKTLGGNGFGWRRSTVSLSPAGLKDSSTLVEYLTKESYGAFGQYQINNTIDVLSMIAAEVRRDYSERRTELIGRFRQAIGDTEIDALNDFFGTSAALRYLGAVREWVRTGDLESANWILQSQDLMFGSRQGLLKLISAALDPEYIERHPERRLDKISRPEGIASYLRREMAQILKAEGEQLLVALFPEETNIVRIPELTFAGLIMR